MSVRLSAVLCFHDVQKDSNLYPRKLQKLSLILTGLPSWVSTRDFPKTEAEVPLTRRPHTQDITVSSS
jgi:hypothetical protein